MYFRWLCVYQIFLSRDILFNDFITLSQFTLNEIKKFFTTFWKYNYKGN